MTRSKAAKLRIEEIKARIHDQNEEALTADGFDKALIGVSYRFGLSPLAAYDYDQCIKILMNRDGMDYDEAVEFFETNTIGAWVGDGTPVFVKKFT